MSSHSIPKLSLVAQYDDLCRYTKVLTEGCEEQFKHFVECQRKLHKRRKEAEAEIEALRKKVNSLEYEKQCYETRLKHMRNTLLSEVEQRKKLEQEKSSMERQIALIKEVLLSNGNTIDNQTKERLFQLSSTIKYQGNSPSKLTTIEESVGSLLSPSDCDDSDADIDNGITRRKRHSKGKRSSGNSSQKRRKSEGKIEYLKIDDAFNINDINVAPYKVSANFRSNSDPNSSSSEALTPRPIHRSDSEQIKEHAFELRRSNTLGPNMSTPSGRYSTGGKRTHAFVSKTVIRTEKCYPCGRVIKFCKQVLKCTDCRVTCHPECKEQCVLPCIPAICTPTKGSLVTIRDYAPSTPPMIPSLIVHCVNEIESRGMKEVGLYRVPGSEREVKDLKEKFLKGKSVPSLNEMDIHAVCGTIKEFLRSLSDTLISKAAWQVCVDAASSSDETQSMNTLFNCVCVLPQPNRDTLAFLILHLQRVAESPDCKMPIDNLAKVFGPTIVGYSVTEPSGSNMLTETRLQCAVMERLLRIPADSWQNLLNVETDPFNNNIKTPECTPAPVTSRLGPILNSSQKPKNTPVSRTPLKPRSTRSGKRQFFSSPLLK